MIVLETTEGSSAPHRIGIIGSCRLRTPILQVKRNGRFDMLISQPPLTHSFREATQVWRNATGEAPVPDALAPYIYDKPQAPPQSAFPVEVLESIDTFVVEMCDLKQLRFGEFVFQNNYFARGFVQKYPKALLAWYRAVTKAGGASEGIIADALAGLAAAGAPDLAQCESLLRGTTLERVDSDEVMASARALVFDPSKRWIFVSHFAPPDDEGTTMRDRRLLASQVHDAATELGAEFFDPTRLIEHYGRKRVLRGNGADIYEYDWDFIPLMGDIIMNLVRDGVSEALELPPFPEKEPLPGQGQVVSGEDVVDLPAGAEDDMKETGINGVKPAAVALQPVGNLGVAALDRPVAPAFAPPPPKTEALASADVLDIVARANSLMIKVGTERRAMFGIEPSGLYPHYSRLLDEGDMVRKRDTKITTLVATRFFNYDSYCVLAAGIGVVPVMLAMAGLPVDAVETNRYRAEALEDVAGRLGALNDPALGHISVHRRRIPDSLGYFASLVIAVGLKPDEDEMLVSRALRHGQALLYEPKSLLGLRDTPEKIEELNQLLATMGYGPPRRLSDALSYATK